MDAKIYQEYNALKKENISDKIKQTILEFIDDLTIEGIYEIRRKNYIQRLRVVARWVPDTFLDPGRDNLKKIILKLSSGYSDWTKTTYLKMLKKFYRYTLPKEKYEGLFANLKINSNPGTKIKPEEIITVSELNKIIENSKNSRDRALFSLLYDSGCRIGEILTMRIKDLKFDEFGAVLMVNGKTGYRQVRIVGDSIPYLKSWLNDHPMQNNPNAYLFCNIENKIKGRMMEYSNVYASLRDSMHSAGIYRRIYPHLFRHTRATLLASKVPEVPLENQMGWIHGSKMTSVYVHLSMRDQDTAILKAYGIKAHEDSIIEVKPKKCPRCNKINPSNAKYCHNCWLPFDEGLALEYQDKEKAIEKTIESSNAIPGITKALIEKATPSFKSNLIEGVLEEILKDPDLLKKFREEINKN